MTSHQLSLTDNIPTVVVHHPCNVFSRSLLATNSMQTPSRSNSILDVSGVSRVRAVLVGSALAMHSSHADAR